MSTNLRIWDANRTPDPAHTKSFSRSGGFKGTAINVTYTIQRLTEQFGPCGIGWGYNIISEEFHPGAPMVANNVVIGNEIVHIIRVALWYIEGTLRGEVVSIGQTMFVGTNKYGPYTDEEAPKKSLSDAITKAASMLGFNADVHLGRWDDNKYLNEVQEEFAKAGQTHTAKAAEAEQKRREAFVAKTLPRLAEIAKEGTDALEKALGALSPKQREALPADEIEKLQVAAHEVGEAA